MCCSNFTKMLFFIAASLVTNRAIADNLKAEKFIDSISDSFFICEIEQKGPTRIFQSVIQGNAKDFSYLNKVKNYNGPLDKTNHYLLIFYKNSPIDFKIYPISNEGIRYGIEFNETISMTELKNLCIERQKISKRHCKGSVDAQDRCSDKLLEKAL